MKLDKVHKILLASVLGLFLVFSTASCAFLNSLFEDKVVTTEDNVKDEFKQTMIPAPTQGIISEADRKKLEESGKAIVLVDKGSVKDPNAAVDITNPGQNAVDGLVGIGLGVANVVFPGVAALEGLGLLFSQRKRQHYAAAVKAITPYDGQVNVTEAIVAIARGMGLAHSSETSKEAFVAEREAEKKAG